MLSLSNAFRPAGACRARLGESAAEFVSGSSSPSDSLLSRGMWATPLSLPELNPGFDVSEMQFILSDKVNFIFERFFETEAGMWILHTAAFYTVLKMFAHYFFWQPSVVKHYQERYAQSWQVGHHLYGSPIKNPLRK
jgi:hypothetical protein